MSGFFKLSLSPIILLGLAAGLATAAPPAGKGKPGGGGDPPPPPPPVRYALHRFSNVGVSAHVEEINDVGELVGFYSDALGGRQSFYFDITSASTTAANLDDLDFDEDYDVPGGWYVDTAKGINNWGDIAASLARLDDPTQERGCVIELRPDPLDTSLKPRLHLIPEHPDWTKTYARRINDDGVVLGGDTIIDVAYIYRPPLHGTVGDSDIQVIPFPLDVFYQSAQFVTPATGGPTFVKASDYITKEILTYDIDTGAVSYMDVAALTISQLNGFNDSGAFCGSSGNRKTKGFVFDGTFHALDNMNVATALNNAGDVIGKTGGNRVILDHAVLGSISLDTTIVAENAEEQAIWDTWNSHIPAISERDSTGFPIIAGTMWRYDTSSGYQYEGYVLIPVAPAP